MNSKAVSMASRNSMPRPLRRCSYHWAASPSSVEASGSVRNGRVTGSSDLGQYDCARLPKVRRQIHRTAHVELAARSLPPRQPGRPPGLRWPGHRGLPIIRRQHRRAHREKASRLREAKFSLGHSCGHCKPGRVSQQAAVPPQRATGTNGLRLGALQPRTQWRLNTFCIIGNRN